jgi:HEAT repeat protein
MIKRLKRILVASAIGLAVCAAGIWVLVRVLDEGVPRFQGQPLIYWLQHASSPDAAASHQAEMVLNTTILPQLTETMFHDTNDSQLRLALIEQLNTLPGVNIYRSTAYGRREEAARQLGQAGPRAKATIPDLIKVLNGKDPAPRAPAAFSLGQIHSEPDTIIPLLMNLLNDPQEGVPEAAATGLGQFGGLAKAAVPKLLQWSKGPDKELRHAAIIAIEQIVPEEAAKAGN